MPSSSPQCAAGRGWRWRRATGGGPASPAPAPPFAPSPAAPPSPSAVRHPVAGVAASIMALQPVLIIPLVVVLHRERVGVGGIAGALVGVAGGALPLLWGV